MQRYGLLLAILGSVASCENSDENPALTRDSFCQQWAERACNEQVVSACQAKDAESCRVTQKAFCLDLVPKEYSSEKARECLDAVGAAYSDADLTGPELNTVLRLSSPCNKLIKGPAGNGESCAEDRQCNGPAGYSCILKGDATEGRCEIPETVGAGLRCSADAQVCDRGFFCDGSNCIAVKVAGEHCGNQVECGDAALCTSEGVCTARLAVGSPCTSDEQCLSNLCYELGGSGSGPTCVDRLRLSPSEPVCQELR